MSKPKLVISTDFDGTLACPDVKRTLAPAFFDWLESAQKRYEVTWIVNTSRPRLSLHDHFKKRFARREPDWIVDMGQALFHWNGENFQADEVWNKKWEDDWNAMFPFMHELTEWTKKEFSGVEIAFPEGIDIETIKAKDIEQAHLIVDQMVKWIQDHTENVFIRPSTAATYIWFDHSHYNKGILLEEICRRLGIGKESAFAIGDGQNDLPMLKKEYAQYLACPANAHQIVKDQIIEEGGYISAHSWDLGVVDALEHFFGK